MVPTWTLLAALTAGLILGVLGSRLFQRPAPLPPPAQPGPEPASSAEPASAEAASAEPPAAVGEPDPAPPVAPAPAAEEEPIRISMEDVVSELERRYQGRQADSTAEKPRSTARRRRAR